jgi:peroxiredoxin
MKKLTLVLTMLLMALSFGVQAQNQEQKPKREELKIGSAMPQIDLKSEVYGNITNKDLKGKVVLINMFATWCGPCQKELAEVQNTLWPKYKDNKNFKMIVIGREHTDEQLTKYNEKKGFTFPLYPDPKRENYSKFADITIPRSYLYDKQGKLIWSAVGYSPEEFKELMETIEKALK